MHWVILQIGIKLVPFVIHYCPWNSLRMNKVLPSPAVTGAASLAWRPALLSRDLLCQHSLEPHKQNSPHSQMPTKCIVGKRSPQKSKCINMDYLDRQLNLYGMDSNWEPLNYISNSLCDNILNDFLDILAVSTVEKALMGASQVAVFVQLPHQSI